MTITKLVKLNKKGQLVIPLEIRKKMGFSPDRTGYAIKINKKFDTHIKANDTVETCALLVLQTYQQVADLLKSGSGGREIEAVYRPLKTPFDRRIRPDLFYAAYRDTLAITKSL